MSDAQIDPHSQSYIRGIVAASAFGHHDPAFSEIGALFVAAGLLTPSGVLNALAGFRAARPPAPDGPVLDESQRFQVKEAREILDTWRINLAGRSPLTESPREQLLVDTAAQLLAIIDTNDGGTAGSSPEQMLREFHSTKRIHGGLMPAEPTGTIPGWVRSLRWELLSEELRELSEADSAGDVVKIADAIADLVYVLVGTAVVHGIPFDAVFAEVHRSNMTKNNTHDEAKLVKGPGYEPPDIARVLDDIQERRP